MSRANKSQQRVHVIPVTTREYQMAAERRAAEKKKKESEAAMESLIHRGAKRPESRLIPKSAKSAGY